ncbi:MAG: hypothetical protein ACYC3I_16600 [Gemmataceae bacterium]
MRRRCRVKLFNYINGTNDPLLDEQVNTWIERIERDFPGFQIDRSHYRTWRTKDDDGDTRVGDTMVVWWSYDADSE